MEQMILCQCSAVTDASIEKLINEPDPEIAHEWMTFVIVGAGPTGVELDGALAEISRRVVRARLPTDRSKARKDL
jgi:NADH dehydrogenase FAD-containing subunit